jgi:hypothetical protein
MIRSLLVLLGTFLIFSQAAAGTWTANEFSYKPALGARGETEKNTYDSGQDRVDARLGKTIWVGDPKLGSTLQSALTYLGSTECILRVSRGTHSISADLTVPANIQLRIEKGAILSVATTKTLTLNRRPEAGPYQIFSWTGTGAIQINGPDRTLLAEWFGASTEAADNGPAVQKAFASFGSVDGAGGGTLVFGHGTYTFTTPAVSGTSFAPDITFKGQGVGNVSMQGGDAHGTRLQYTGGGTLFPMHPLLAVGSSKGWHWQDLAIYCTSTGSAIEMNDITLLYNQVPTVTHSSLRNVSIFGTGGWVGIGGLNCFYLETSQNFQVRGFYWGIYLSDSDGNVLRGAAVLNNQNVRIVTDRAHGSTAGNDNTVRMMMMQLADYGDDRYLIYDTGSHTKYEHCQYEGGAGDSAFYLNGSDTVLEHCQFTARGPGRIGPDAKNVYFLSPTGTADTPWVVDEPTSYQSLGLGECYVYVINPKYGYRSVIPNNPRVVILADQRTGNTNLSTGNPRTEGGLDKAEAATHSLGAFMGQPGGHSAQMLINAFTKGWNAFAPGVSWLADAAASTGWAIKVEYGGGAKVLSRYLKVGTQVNSGDTLAVTIRYRTTEAVTGGGAGFSLSGTVYGTIVGWDAVTTPTANYQEVTKTFVLPALTFGEVLKIEIQHDLAGAGGNLDLYIDYLAIVPYAQALRSRAFVVEKQSVAYAATVTPDWSKGSFLAVGQLTGGLTVANPSVDAVQGQKVCVSLSAVGSNRAIVWGGKYKTAYTTVSANKQAVVEFMFDGANYIQVGTVQEL